MDEDCYRTVGKVISQTMESHLRVVVLVIPGAEAVVLVVSYGVVSPWLVVDLVALYDSLMLLIDQPQ